MYCGGSVAEPHHSKCQWCSVIIAQANCDGVYDRVIEIGEVMQARLDLSVDARRAQIQTAYDVAVNG
jgi:hypothetical protein